jgi:hypothetical protein
MRGRATFTSPVFDSVEQAEDWIDKFRKADEIADGGGPLKSQQDYGELFFWVLAGIPLPNSEDGFVFYVVPSSVMAQVVTEGFHQWVSTPGKKGQQHDETNEVRTVHLPPRTERSGWSLEPFRNRWDLIVTALAG